jgi:hypothetical protein
MDPICDPSRTCCKYCNESPCILNWKDDALDPERSLYDYLMWHGEEMIDAGLLPRDVLYELYQTASKFYHEYLGKLLIFASRLQTVHLGFAFDGIVM